MEKRNRTNKKRGNGEGTIYWSEALQRYVAQYVDDTGTRKTMKQRRNEKVSDFKKRFNDINASLNNGTYIAQSNKTLIDILNEHIEYKHNNNITGDRAYTRNKNTLEQIKKNLNEICTMPIQKITTSHIMKVTPNINHYSQGTINKIWNMLCKGFKIAVSDRLIIYNPIENINVIKPKSTKITKPVEALTTLEHKKLTQVLKETENKYNDILLLQLYTGMRIGEVLALSKDCIDLNKEQITIYRTLTRDKNDKTIMGKTAKTLSGIRTIFMTPETKKLCQKLLNNKLINMENLLFYDYQNNTYITPTEVNCYLKRLNTKYNITDNIHTHMLRHTFATRFIEAGGSAKVLQKILGHSNIQTTLNIYTSVFEEYSKDENEKYILYMQALGL